MVLTVSFVKVLNFRKITFLLACNNVILSVILSLFSGSQGKDRLFCPICQIVSTISCQYNHMDISLLFTLLKDKYVAGFGYYLKAHVLADDAHVVKLLLRDG